VEKEKVSRRQFLRNTAIGAVGVATAGFLGGCSSDAGNNNPGAAVYKPGTYTGTAKGMGQVTVTMTFSETAITDVKVDCSNETAEIGGAATSGLQEALMAAQSAEIDGVSGATMTSDAVKEAAAEPSALPWQQPNRPTSIIHFLLAKISAMSTLPPTAAR